MTAILYSDLIAALPAAGGGDCGPAEEEGVQKLLLNIFSSLFPSVKFTEVAVSLWSTRFA